MNWTEWMGAWIWRLGLVASVLVTAFAGGCQYGEGRVQEIRQAEATARVIEVARQKVQVKQTETRQEQINKEISDDFKKKKTALVGLRPVVRDSHVRLRGTSSGDQHSVSEVPGVAAGIAAAASDDVPASSVKAIDQGCVQLVHDAAETTLMLIEIQRWYEQQAQLHQQK